MTHRFPRQTSTIAAQAPLSPRRFRRFALGWLLFGMTLLVLAAVPAARAEVSVQKEVASVIAKGVPSILHQAALNEKAGTGDPIVLRGACHEGQAVFTVTNKAKDWAGRGFLRITDTQSGHTLRERWMRFKEGQSASFRILPGLAPSGRYRISVTLPDRIMTYKKSFRGHCPQPVAEVRNASR